MAIGTFSLAVIDCPDSAEMARFYSAITGWPLDAAGSPDTDSPDTDSPDNLDSSDDSPEHENWLQLHGPNGATLAFQEIADFVRPTWPAGEHPQQLHLDFDVDDLDRGEADVLALGARKTDVQPSPDSFRVYLDPAGHPFCLVRAD